MEIERKNKMASYVLFLASIVVMGLGISLVTHANVGTTAITSPPFVLSLSSLPLTFGTLTILFNITYIVIQIILMKEKFPKIQYLQIVVSFILGIAIDFWTAMVQNFTPTNYLVQLALVLIGCFIIAFSTRMQLKADVVNNPAEGIVRAISTKTKSDFGSIKVKFDVFLVALAIVLSFVLFGNIQGVREGTIISAFITGYMVTWISKYY